MNGQYLNYAETSHFDLYWFKTTENQGLHWRIIQKQPLEMFYENRYS